MGRVMIFKFILSAVFILVIAFFGCKNKPMDIYDPKNYELISKDSNESYEIYVLKENSNRKMQKFYWNNGNLQAISFFLNNKRDGKWQSFFEDGKLSAESIFTDGKENGDQKTYFINGKVATIERYRNGEKIGTWEYYDTSGTLIKIKQFK
jgi:antitoxin component YwqK of YwqJK toxin-antitoxin module